jgi:hypothetical protein
MFRVFSVNGQKLVMEFSPDETVQDARSALSARLNLPATFALSCNGRPVNQSSVALKSIPGQFEVFSKVPKDQSEKHRPPSGVTIRHQPPASAPSQTVVSPGNSQFLIDIGFERSLALRALRETGDDVNAAIRLLTDEVNPIILKR